MRRGSPPQLKSTHSPCIYELDEARKNGFTPSETIKFVESDLQSDLAKSSADELGTGKSSQATVRRSARKKKRKESGRLKSGVRRRSNLRSANRKFRKVKCKKRGKVSNMTVRQGGSATETEESSASSSRDVSPSRSTPELVVSSQPDIVSSAIRKTRGETPLAYTDDGGSESDSNKPKQQSKGKKRRKRRKKRKSTSERDVSSRNDRKTPVVIRGRPESMTPPSSPEASKVENLLEYKTITGGSPRLPPLEKKFLVHAPDFQSDFKNHYDQFSSRKVKNTVTSQYCMYTQQDPNKFTKSSRSTYSSTDNPHDFWLEHLRRASENAFFQKPYNFDTTNHSKDKPKECRVPDVVLSSASVKSLRRQSRDRERSHSGERLGKIVTGSHGTAHTPEVVHERSTPIATPKKKTHTPRNRESKKEVKVTMKVVQVRECDIVKETTPKQDSPVEERVPMTSEDNQTTRETAVENNNNHDDFDFVTFSDAEDKKVQSVDNFVNSLIQKSVSTVRAEIPGLDLSQLVKSDDSSLDLTKDGAVCDVEQETSQKVEIDDVNLVEDTKIENPLRFPESATVIFDKVFIEDESKIPTQPVPADTIITKDVDSLTSTVTDIVQLVDNQANHTDSDISEDIEVDGDYSSAEEITLDSKTAIEVTPDRKLGQPKKQVRFNGYKAKKKR